MSAQRQRPDVIDPFLISIFRQIEAKFDYLGPYHNTPRNSSYQMKWRKKNNHKGSNYCLLDICFIYSLRGDEVRELFKYFANRVVNPNSRSNVITLNDPIYQGTL